MKTLSKLSQLLSQKEILTHDEAADLKGGRRFRAATLRRALRKVRRLVAKGHSPTMTEYDDHYCIEW